MRKNHHGKKDRLVKRVFALCLALAVICTCLVPVFATEGLIDPQVNQEASRPVDDGEASYPDDEFAGFGEEEASRPVEGGEAAGFGEEEATRPVEGGEDNLDGGPSVKETEWGTVIEYGPSSSTGTDPSSSTETQWSGEDDVVEKPDDKVVVSGDEIKKLQDMVVYRFWLRELNTLDLQDITAQAQINNMTESEYLARNGEVLWNLYFIQAVPRVETIADYSSYIENPSSNRDPKGELRLFDYWYTLDEFGNRVRLNLTDPTSNILDDKTTTVNVYAAWKDGTVGSDEEEDVDHEDLVDKNPVPVDLTAKASASYEDEDGELKTTTLPVEVKNLPSAAHSLSVIHMGDDDMESFYESHEDDFGSMAPILGLKISPKNAKGETVQPAKGEKATVTVSGLDKLPEIAAMEEEGALTADALKVLHQTADGSVETLDVLTYTNGTLTFETTSFSPFVVVRTDGYDTELLDERAATAAEDGYTVKVGGKTKITGKKANYHEWSSESKDIAKVSGSKSTATVTGISAGRTTITHRYKDKKKNDWEEEKFTVTVMDWKQVAGLYIMFNPVADPDSNAMSMWTDVVTVNNEHAKLGSLDGAIWDSKQKNIFFRDNGGADGDNAKQYIMYWPDNEPYDGPRVLKPGDSFRDTPVTYNGTHSTLGEMLLEQYKSKLNEKYGKDFVDTLGAENVTFTITPHKISKNVLYPKMHIDCTVTVTCDEAFTAVFNVKESAKSNYTPVYKELYLWDDVNKNNNTVTKYTKNPDGFTDENGVKWEFDGWCLEDVTTGKEPGENAGVISDDDWNHYIVNEDVLKNHGGDRVVNFYAHYRKATSDVTITKEVTGLLGDTTRYFNFSVSITTQDNKDCTAEVKAEKANNVPVDDLSNFTLRHNETVTLKNVPIGATITVTEVKPGEHYKVSATGYGEQNGSDSGNVTFTYVAVANTPTGGDANEANLMLLSVDEDTAVGDDGEAVAYDTGAEVTNNQITVINRCDLMPDTGVLLDTLPYIVILAVVAGGVALLMLRKRRKEDD